MAQPNSSPWFQYLDQMHSALFDKHPDLAQAIADAREWDSPLTFLSASFLANSKPAELERLILRTMIFLDLPPERRRELIEEERAKQEIAWAEQGRAMQERERSRKPPPGGFVEVDLSQISL